MAVRVYSVYDEDLPRQGFDCEGESMTQQQFLEECDINRIMQRYQETGVLVDPMVGTGTRQPIFGDFSEEFDLREAMDKVNDAYEQFYQLPSRIRERFDNSPVKLLEFLRDSENYDEAVKLGLVKPRETEPVAVPEGASKDADQLPT